MLAKKKNPEHATIFKDAGLELRQVYHLALFVFNTHRIAPR
jgi:hypothetical protein